MRQPLSYFTLNAWRWKLEMPELPPKEILPSPEGILKLNWCEKFTNFCKNRVIMGAFRYGVFNAPGKKQYNRLDYIKRKVIEYEKDGNDEHLFDISNAAMLEFVEGTNINKHFKSIDDKNHANT